MALTYTTNNSIILYTGQHLKFANDINQASISNLIDNTRTQAYNYINNMLRGRTATPATDTEITVQLKEIEKNFVIGWLMGAGLSGERGSESEWPKFYLDLAEKLLNKISFPASASVPVYESYNVGNGILTISKLNDMFTRTELWVATYEGNEYFSIVGSKSGRLPSLQVDENYPDEELVTTSGLYDSLILYSSLPWGEFPFYCSISAGSVDWSLYDRLTWWTYSSSFKSKITNAVRIRRTG